MSRLRRLRQGWETGLYRHRLTHLSFFLGSVGLSGSERYETHVSWTGCSIRSGVGACERQGGCKKRTNGYPPGGNQQVQLCEWGKAAVTPIEGVPPGGRFQGPPGERFPGQSILSNASAARSAIVWKVSLFSGVSTSSGSSKANAMTPKMGLCALMGT